MNSLRCGDCKKIEHIGGFAYDCTELKHIQTGRKLAVAPELIKADCRYAKKKDDNLARDNLLHTLGI